MVQIFTGFATFVACLFNNSLEIMDTDPG